MPISRKIAGDQWRFTGRGLVTAAEIMETISDSFTEAPLLKVFWDFRDASLSEITAKAFKDIAAVAEHFKELRGDGTKAVFCVSDESSALLFKYYIDLPSASEPTRIRVSMDYDDLDRWLAE